ncbi:hypothetical protein M434DRAFT_160454 [Hypoxylon sp. CO27-5]|nr:hypothetical protein M434DRAFT_160454 [Hypoxylon sp. CO27-5]
MRNLRNLTFFLWLEFDSCLPEPSNYDTVLRIVSPLKELSKRVSFRFAISAVNIDQGLQARLYENGYRNPRIDAVEGLRRM